MENFATQYGKFDHRIPLNALYLETSSMERMPTLVQTSQSKRKYICRTLEKESTSTLTKTLANFAAKSAAKIACIRKLDTMSKLLKEQKLH